MPSKSFFLIKTIPLIFNSLSRLVFRRLRGLRRSNHLSNNYPHVVHNNNNNKQQQQQQLPIPISSSCSSTSTTTSLINSTLIFDVEASLLKSSSLFPYFMLVAFEAGSILRAFLLLLSYPLICLAGEEDEELGLSIMVMISFFGLRKDSFRLGTSVLPKFFLQDVGLEMFEMVKKAKTSVAVSDMPQVMIECFLRDYLEIDHVVGRQVKAFHGYYVGVLEDHKHILNYYDKIINTNTTIRLDDEKESCACGHHVIGVFGFQKYLHRRRSLLFSQYCKEIHLVKEVEKRGWRALPRDKYPKPLIFHDGRLAFKPFPMEALAMFMWVPFGLVVGAIRMVLALSLPHKLATPLLAFCGFRLTFTTAAATTSNININSTTIHDDDDDDDDDNKGVIRRTTEEEGVLYVCNHRTLLDPLYLSFILQKNVTAVTYSLSRFSEMMAPIKTVRLSRDRDQDAKMMQKLLREGDLVVCPEGTTCREPYLLRFSPLFAEMTKVIVPVAFDCQVTMFHGTTAGGLKSLDPLFFLFNPFPTYTAQLLQPLPGLLSNNNNNNIMAPDSSSSSPPPSKYDVANRVQKEIATALGFHCTMLTRRDKYMILAGNEGVISTHAQPT